MRSIKSTTKKKCKRRKYMITCISQRIKEHQNPCATIWFMVKLNGNKRHRIGQRERKKHSREEHHHSHTYKQHTFPHSAPFLEFHKFQKSDIQFLVAGNHTKKPICHAKKIYNDNLQPSPPSPASASYIPTPLAEGDRRATWRRKIPPPRPARGRRRPSDVINPTPEERRRDGDEEEKAPVLRKKLKGKGGGKGERAQEHLQTGICRRGGKV